MRLSALPLLMLIGCSAPGFSPRPPPPPAWPMAAPAAVTEGGGAQLWVEPRTVSAGGRVMLLLRNGSPHNLGFNLCSSGLEQRRGGTWVNVPQNRACTRQLNVVGPGRQAQYAIDLPASLAAGEYRFLTGITYQRDTPERTITYGQETVSSETFFVRG